MQGGVETFGTSLVLSPNCDLSKFCTTKVLTRDSIHSTPQKIFKINISITKSVYNKKISRSGSKLSTAMLLKSYLIKKGTILNYIWLLNISSCERWIG